MSDFFVRYLCEKYDTSNKVFPKDQPTRAHAQIWVHAAEGTFMLHSLAILYARWQFPEEAKKAAPGALEQLEKNMSVNVGKDLDWLEKELSQTPGPFLLGSKPTVADIMMEFSIDFILTRGLGAQRGQGWPKVHKWLEACQANEAYKQAVKRTGHTLHPKTT